MSTFTFSSTLFRYTAGKWSWYFIRINQEDANYIRWIEDKHVQWWGSIPVEVTIGNSTWQTSIFPDKEKTYLLPVKVYIRKQENLKEWTLIHGTLRFL